LTPDAEDLRLRALRPPKLAVDPWRPLGVLAEPERAAAGGVVATVAVFLAGRECPFTCVFCDLWRATLDGATPRGALPEQLRRALADLGVPASPQARLKLYNASNFFDPLAVPPEDLPALAALAAPFARVVVESHPRLVGPRSRDFAALLDGGLEVAMGLETVHPEALERLNKRMTLGDFDRAAEFLRAAGATVRAFVLVGAPHVPPEEGREWTRRSTAHALDAGAETVSLIPVRGGNGALERLAAEGAFRPPALADLERALEDGLEEAASRGRGVVLADLWDAGRFAPCPACREARLERLGRLNLSGHVEPPVACAVCGDDEPR
jgi:hypothetical protein